MDHLVLSSHSNKKAFYKKRKIALVLRECTFYARMNEEEMC